MKRYLSIAAAALLFSGCSAMTFSDPLPDFDSCYIMQTELEFSGTEAAADVTRNGAGSWIFTFTQPPELMGVTITIEDDELTASLGSLSVTTELSNEWCSAPQRIAEGLDSLSTLPPESITESDGILTLNTQLDGKPCQVTADKATGRLIALKYPHGELSAYFSEQQVFSTESTDSSSDSSETEEHVGLVIE